MRKQFLLFALLVAAVFSAGAAEVALRVTGIDGGESVFLLDRQPEVAFLAGKLQVTTADEQPVVFELDDVASIDFPGAQSGVGSTDAPAAGITVAVSGSAVTFGNIPAGSMVEVFSASGAAVKALRASGNLTLDRSELPSGVYIVRINNFVTKVAF